MVTRADRPRPASARGRLWLWVRRLLVVLVGLILLLVIAGLVYQFVATRLAYRENPAPGKRRERSPRRTRKGERRTHTGLLPFTEPSGSCLLGSSSKTLRLMHSGVAHDHHQPHDGPVLRGFPDTGGFPA